MLPLFKYMKRKYADGLALRGEVRLGDLYGYRSIEHHAPMIGDKDEGVKELFEVVDHATGENLSEFVDRWFISRSLGVLVRNSAFNLHVVHPNCWLFCTSMRLSAKVMHSMDPEYDACVRIDEAGLFCQIIANELVHRDLMANDGVSARIERCVYGQKSRRYQEDYGLNPIILKDPSYAEQEEVRFVFLARDHVAVDPIQLELPALARCCRLVESIPGLGTPLSA